MHPCCSSLSRTVHSLVGILWCYLKQWGYSACEAVEKSLQIKFEAKTKVQNTTCNKSSLCKERGCTYICQCIGNFLEKYTSSWQLRIWGDRFILFFYFFQSCDCIIFIINNKTWKMSKALYCTSLHAIINFQSVQYWLEICRSLILELFAFLWNQKHCEWYWNWTACFFVCFFLQSCLPGHTCHFDPQGFT